MTTAARTLRDCAAPAKLNVFLHVTGRRPDGYHTLQTAFQLLDWRDTLHFTARGDDAVVRVTPVAGVPAETDLTVRAARLLQAHTGCRLGVEIEIDKRLPMGAGLGGGSSDAATTLLALNRLWSLNLDRARLQALGLALGADVPFFLAGGNAFAEGVGEQLTPIALPPRHFLVVMPAAHVSTAQIFGDGELTRDTKPVTITDFLAHQNSFAFGRNDLQPVVAKKYTEVAQVLDWFSGMVPARMTGSGACVFSAFDDRESAVAVQAALPSGWSSVVVAGLARHPLSDRWS